MAAWIALKASVSPGLLLGIATWFVARGGTWPKIATQQTFLSVCIVIAVTEIFAVASGVLAYWAKSPIYPKQWYPDLRLPLVVSQTIQITCYFVAFLASGAMLLMMYFWRKYLKRGSEAKDQSRQPAHTSASMLD